MANCLYQRQFYLSTALNVATYSNCTDGDVHLVGGVSQYQGRVEVCLNKAQSVHTVVGVVKEAKNHL